MASAAGVWNQLWFEPASPRGLVVVRVVAAAQALWILLSRPDIPDLATWPAEFWSSVDPSLALRFGIGLPRAGEWALFWVLHAALVAALLGFWPRTSGFVSALLLYHFAPFDEIFTSVVHTFFGGFTFPVLALLVLAFAEVPRWNGLPSPEYRWPLSLARMLLAASYFFAGVAKLYWVGPSWFTGESLRGILLSHWSFDRSPWALWAAGSLAFCWVMVLATALFELLFPLAVVSRRVAPVFVMAALLFHAGILLTLRLVFLSLPSLLIFLDWDRIDARLRARKPTGPLHGEPGAAAQP